MLDGRTRSCQTECKGEVHVSAIYFQHDAKYSAARGVPDRVLENCEVLQELAEQIITKVGCTEKFRNHFMR
jgi:hypothetical protein